LIVYWPEQTGGPGQLPDGSINDERVLGFDLFPSFAALAGVDVSDLTELQGRDVSATLFPGSPLDRTGETFFWEKKECADGTCAQGEDNLYAVIEDQWKLLHQSTITTGKFPKGFRHADYCVGTCLFDLSLDPRESADVSAQHPIRTAYLQARYLDWRQQVGRIPHTVDSTTGGVTGSDPWNFDGTDGVVVLSQSSLYAFQDADFSLRLTLTPALLATARDQVIAERPKTWELWIAADGRLHFDVWGHRKADPEWLHGMLSLQSDAALNLDGATAVDVTITIHGFQGSKNNFHMYLDGTLQTTANTGEDIWSAYAGLCTDVGGPYLGEGCMWHDDCADGVGVEGICQRPEYQGVCSTGPLIGTQCDFDNDCGAGESCSFAFDNTVVDTRIRIGDNVAGTSPYEGLLADLKLYSIALKAEEIDPPPETVPNCIDTDDCDADGAPDAADNCKWHQNFAGLGTCTAGSVGAMCTQDDDCTPIVGVCETTQIDSDTNGVGDACEPITVPEPSLLLTLSVAAPLLRLMKRWPRKTLEFRCPADKLSEFVELTS
jgi:hypothetical protein